MRKGWRYKNFESYGLGLILFAVPLASIALSRDNLVIDQVLLGLNLLVGFLIWIRLRQAQSEQAQTANQFKQVFATNVVGFVINDRTGNIIDANDHYLSLTQKNRADLRAGMNWSDFTPPEHLATCLRGLRELEQTGQTNPYEIEYLRADGSRIWVLIGATAIGENIMSFVLDISERKRVRVDLEEAKNRLEENVAQRTKELLEANRELHRIVNESEIAAERFRESQSFLDSVIENIPNMIFVKDAEELRFVRLNRAGENLLGVDKVDILGKSDYDFFPQEQADYFTAKDRAVLEAKTVLDISEEPIATSRGERFLHTKKLPICDKLGKPVYLLGISEDITEKKQVESQKAQLMHEQAARIAAERSAEKLKFLSEATAALNASLDVHSLLKAFTDVIVKHMADWCVIDFYFDKDQSVERMVATAADGNLPEGFHTWWDERSLDLNAQEGIGAVIRTGEARIYRKLDSDHVTQYFRDKETLDRILEWGIQSSMVTPLSYHGKVFGTLTFVSTRQDRFFDDFDLSVAQDLAKRASLAIENAKLYAKTFEASRAKSAFLANISHEIRTPLGAMLGFAELILDDKNLSSGQADYVSTIARNGRQLLRIVDEILDLSKVESDRIQIERISFSLHALFAEVWDLLKIKSDEKGLTLAFRGIDKLPAHVITDPLRLRQVLINVVGNALKFTHRGSVIVEASFKMSKLQPKFGILEIVVTDTGVGLSEEQTGKLFQPFVQADESMTRKFGGTGLGLYLSRRLARLLRGDVTLRRSSPGRGSEFVIHIEVETVAAVAATAPGPALDSAIGSGLALAPPSPNGVLRVNAGNGANHVDHIPTDARVLVVDDSADNRMLIDAMLKKSGIRLEMAENGISGVEKALAHEFDLVFMDIQMPEMDGYEAIKTLAKKGYRVPVVALTAHAMKGDRERCLKAGFTDYICKPVTRQALLKCLERYTSGGADPGVHLH